MIIIIIIVIILKKQTTNRIPSTRVHDPLSYYILGQSNLKQVVIFHVKVHVNQTTPSLHCRRNVTPVSVSKFRSVSGAGYHIT